ncbi:MAG: hypothetical protein ACI822_001597 [Gammaproteobacteria bacterium]|jgi:hypothetical protein
MGKYGDTLSDNRRQKYFSYLKSRLDDEDSTRCE